MLYVILRWMTQHQDGQFLLFFIDVNDEAVYLHCEFYFPSGNTTITSSFDEQFKHVDTEIDAVGCPPSEDKLIINNIEETRILNENLTRDVTSESNSEVKVTPTVGTSLEIEELTGNISRNSPAEETFNGNLVSGNFHEQFDEDANTHSCSSSDEIYTEFRSI